MEAGVHDGDYSAGSQKVRQSHVELEPCADAHPLDTWLYRNTRSCLSLRKARISEEIRISYGSETNYRSIGWLMCWVRLFRLLERVQIMHDSRHRRGFF